MNDQKTARAVPNLCAPGNCTMENVARFLGLGPWPGRGRDTDAEIEARREREDQEAAGRMASPTRDDDDELAEWCDREEAAARTKEEAVI